MSIIAPKPPFVLLENSQTGLEGCQSYLFSECAAQVEARSLDEVEAALRQIEDWQAQGLYTAGWIAYEAGFAFEPKLKALNPQIGPEPLIWFGAFHKREPLDTRALERFWGAAQPTLTPYKVAEPRPSLDFKTYESSFKRIQEWIEAGDVYQVNLTFPMAFSIQGGLTAFYKWVREAQRVAFGAYIVTADWAALSFSPELFIAREGEELISRPMKGTQARPFNIKEDEAAAQNLAQDEKSRAENLMIVDLIRNDMARIAKSGSVHVPSLFNVEAYTTVLQMTSEVRSRSNAAVSDIMRAMFPCGSVTGAPKIRAMEVIHACEDHPRGIYTGAIGHVAPSGDFAFSVPIRTIISDHDGNARLSVGSGIVADSAARAEYDECLLKARFLSASKGPFDLFETLYWDPDEGFKYLDAHLARLQNSAHYFGFACSVEDVKTALENAVAGMGEAKRVRLCLSRLGAISVEAKNLPPTPQQPALIAYAGKRVSSKDPYLRHKTTVRSVYTAALANARAKSSCFDALLENERGEITEGCFTTLFIERNGELLTPALQSGLLPGILRQIMLQDGRCREAVLKREDVMKADAIYIGNSLRGLIPAMLA